MTRLRSCVSISSVLSILLTGAFAALAGDGIAVRGGVVHPVSGPPIEDGVVLVRDGRIVAIGPGVTIPEGFEVLEAAVVTPGLIDAHSVVGLAGYLNQKQDQDQLESSSAIQPELRAIDAYNDQERLLEWIRGFGVTTVHTGHAPGWLVSGQTMIVKTGGETMAGAVIRPFAMVAATLGPSATRQGPDRGKAPGTRSKAVALLRAELIRAAEYAEKRASAEEEKAPPRDLRLEALAEVLSGERPLLITANRHNDILAALRVQEEFGFPLVLDGASEAYLVLDEIRQAGVPVIIHPAMTRAYGERENLSFETAGQLARVGIPFAFQSGYESYVPKTRVVLFEAAVAGAHGLTFEQTLEGLTLDAARILGIADRVGSLEVGKDADLALYDGDPFEYTTHCVGVILDGLVVSQEPR